jgi:hypothetical protein
MLLFSNWLKMWERSFLLSYIDAGTGSLLIQVVIGAVAGGLLALKMSWKRLKNWAKRDTATQEKVKEDQEHVIGQ